MTATMKHATVTVRNDLEEALSVTSSRRWDADKRAPLVPSSGEGARFVDTSGKEYIDLTSCTGAAPLGMRYRPVLDAMVTEMHRSGGILPGTITTLRTAVARQLIDTFPCAERALFFRTGSCATSGAARLARVRTGRPLILTAGFHGWHDWQLQYKGTPDVVGRDAATIDFGYDLEYLDDLLQRYSKDVAAVFVTPEATCMPMDDLRRMQDLGHAHGSLFILDEVITASRFEGGIHRHLGLAPDLITVSKGLCNGAALSAVVGAAAVMGAQEATYLGNTYLRETTPYAGALVSIPALHADGGIQTLSQLTEALVGIFNAAFVESGLAARAIGRGGIFHVLFEEEVVGDSFYVALRDRGVHAEFGGTHLANGALTHQDLADVADAVLLCAREAAFDWRAEMPATGITEEAFSRFCDGAFEVRPGVAARWWRAHADLGVKAAQRAD